MWEKTWPELLKAAGTLLGVVVGYFLKEIGDRRKKDHERATKHPLLKLSFEEKADCQTFPIEIETGTLDPNPAAKFMYVRVAVTNVNPDIAKDVRAYLVDVENVLDPTAAKPSHFVKTEYHDSLPLIWANEPSADSVVLPKGVTRHFDLVSLTEHTKHYEMQFRGPSGKRMLVGGYDNLFKKSSALRFTVLVAGDNCEPQSLSLTIVWNGTWAPKIISG